MQEILYYVLTLLKIFSMVIFLAMVKASKILTLHCSFENSLLQTDIVEFYLYLHNTNFSCSLFKQTYVLIPNVIVMENN